VVRGPVTSNLVLTSALASAVLLGLLYGARDIDFQFRSRKLRLQLEIPWHTVAPLPQWVKRSVR
jgi:hypothetical protein